MEVTIEKAWKEVLKAEFQKPYFQMIPHHLKTEKEQGKTIYPPGSQIFNAFDSTPFHKVKVVLLGQDPYHGKGQAHGLCFSVSHGIAQPPSLINIFKELRDDVGVAIPPHGNLNNWAQQGVFLLNTSLTVRAAEPMSHAKIGWEIFTNAVIQLLSEKRKNLVFLLWGKFAQEKAKLINSESHCILTASHPSPLSAHNGFLGCRHFSKTNEFLISKGIDPINWQL